MIKIILAFVFLFSSFALAEKDRGKYIGMVEANNLHDWTFISKSENGYSYYLELSSIKRKLGMGKNEELFSYNLLIDYQNSSADGTLSVMTNGYINCKDLIIRSSAFVYYKENMQRGNGTLRFPPKNLKDWRKPKHNSELNKIINKTCEKYDLPGSLPDEF